MKSNKKIALELWIIILVAILLSFINYKHGYREIQNYSTDNGLNLGYNAIFDRVLVNIDFTHLEYMEGNNPIHYIGPSIFYLSAVLFGSYVFLSLNKSYFQFIFVRAQSKKDAVAFILNGYFRRTISFVFSYILALLYWIYRDNPSALLQDRDILTISTFFSVSAIIIISSLTLILYILYIKYDEVIAIVSILLLIFIIFGLNIKFPNESIVFIGGDTYFSTGIILGLVSLIILYMTVRMIKYEIK